MIDRSKRWLANGLFVAVLGTVLAATGVSTAFASPANPVGHTPLHAAVVAPHASWPAGSLTIPAGKLTLLPGGRVSSQNEKANLALTDVTGQLFVYDELGNPRWQEFARGGVRASFQSDGNLVVYNASNKAIFASNTSNVPGMVNLTLAIQSDGNVVIYGFDTFDGEWEPLWATGTNH